MAFTKQVCDGSMPGLYQSIQNTTHYPQMLPVLLTSALGLASGMEVDLWLPVTTPKHMGGSSMDFQHWVPVYLQDRAAYLPCSDQTAQVSLLQSVRRDRNHLGSQLLLLSRFSRVRLCATP